MSRPAAHAANASTARTHGHAASHAAAAAASTTASAATVPTVEEPILSALYADTKYWRLKQQMKEEFSKLERQPNDPARAAGALATLLAQHGADATLRSILTPAVAEVAASSQSDGNSMSHGPSPPLPTRPEPLDYVWRARCEWEKRLRFELKAVGKKQARPLLMMRETADHLAAAKSLANGVNVPPPNAADFQVRYVYTAEDLLEVLCAIRNPNQMPPIPPPSTLAQPMSSASKPPPSSHWGMIKLELPVLTHAQLVSKFALLSPAHRQVGVDDTVLGLEWFLAERQKTGEELLAQSGASAATPAQLRHFSKTGLPASLRPAYWARMMGVALPLTAAKASAYRALLSSVARWSLLTDDLLQFDVADGPGDDEAFFVFAEQLEELMLAFSRDREVRERTSLLANSAPIHARPTAQLKKQLDRATSGALADDKTKPTPPSTADLPSPLVDSIPPSRLIPFHRLVYFATPHCFLYARAPDAYWVFREMYCRWFCRLSIVSSAPSGILALSRAFESILAARAPHLVYKCLSVGVHPLQCAFGWLFSAFSGYLEVDQLLLLWDRLLAFECLELLAVLAAAIFLWRERSIMRATTKVELQDAMRELINIKVVPLLQHFLFAG